MSFGPFLAILQCITSKKLQKLPQNWTSKKNPVSTEIAKNAKFLFSTNHKSPKYVQKIKNFLPNNVSYPQTHRKKFLQASEQYSRNEPQIPEKKKRFYRNQDEVEILAESKCFNFFHSTPAFGSRSVPVPRAFEKKGAWVLKIKQSFCFSKPFFQVPTFRKQTLFKKNLKKTNKQKKQNLLKFKLFF